MATLPPAQPSYIFRGHTSQIHSVQIARQNSRLITGDADGWVVCWRLESKRPVAVWRAHDASILGTAEWGVDKIITHGRDNALRIWQLRAADESTYSSILPAEDSTAHRPKPWLLHSLPVNTLNFCAFSMCHERPARNKQRSGSSIESGKDHAPPTSLSDSVLVAVPSRDDKKIEVYQFPDEKLVSVVPRVQTTDTGMVMAVKLAHHQPSNNLMVVAGYEGGYTAVHLLNRSSQATGKPIPDFAKLIYLSQPHTQPILSLDASPDGTTYFTSSADAVIAAHRVSEIPLNNDHNGTPSTTESREGASVSLPTLEAPTQNSTSQDVRITEEQPTKLEASEATPSQPLTFPKSSDISSSKNTALSFHKQSYIPSTAPKRAGLSSLLSSAPPLSKAKPKPPHHFDTTVQAPYKIAQTKHAGQQSLRVRSDGRLLITGGWDSRVRIYSTKTLKEVAVLKWHKEGVYAVDFGEVLDTEQLMKDPDGDTADNIKDDGSLQSGQVIAKEQSKVNGLRKLQQQREEQIKSKHWVAAGSKDGKVSLWEVF